MFYTIRRRLNVGPRIPGRIWKGRASWRWAANQATRFLLSEILGAPRHYVAGVRKRRRYYHSRERIFLRFCKGC